MVDSDGWLPARWFGGSLISEALLDEAASAGIAILGLLGIWIDTRAGSHAGLPFGMTFAVALWLVALRYQPTGRRPAQ